MCKSHSFMHVNNTHTHTHLQIGNAVEVAESVQCLQGKGPRDLDELVILQGGHLLALNGSASSASEGQAMIHRVLSDGSALAKFREMVVAQVREKRSSAFIGISWHYYLPMLLHPSLILLWQGATEEVAAKLCADPWSVLPRAAHITPILAPASGFVVDIDAMALARTVCAIGAGRMKTTDLVDHAVGLELRVCVGDEIVQGSPWLLVHHNAALSSEHASTLLASLTVGAQRVSPPPRGVGVIQGPGDATFYPF